jgi:hypothetical protein
MSDGSRTWLIPDAYLPAAGPPGAYQGHESLCVLNTGPRTATVRIHFYFADRPAVKDVTVRIGAERCLHVRFDRPEMLGGFVVPREVPYGLKVESDEPVVVQHSRLDVTQANMAFLSVVAHPG